MLNYNQYSRDTSNSSFPLTPKKYPPVAATEIPRHNHMKSVEVYNPKNVL